MPEVQHSYVIKTHMLAGTPKQDGLGVQRHFVLALELYRLAASAGDPAAQAAMGVRYTYGLHEPRAWSEDGIVQFGEVRG